MKQQHIDRINELARKAKTNEGLTPEELEERKALRQAYMNEFRQSLQMQLDNTYIVDHKGNKTKLKKKQEKPGSVVIRVLCSFATFNETALIVRNAF